MLVMLLLVGLTAAPQAPDQTLADFTRLARETGQDVVIVDHEGTVREGLLISATADALTMKFVGGEHVFPKSTIASVERLRDGTSDGAMKGAAIGAVIAGIIAGSGGTAGFFTRSVVTYTAIGWLIDVANKNRQPVYRAAPAPAFKLSFTF